MKVLQLKRDEDQNELMVHLDPVSLEKGLNFKRTVKHKKKNGEIFNIEINSHRIKFPWGYQVIVVGHDMTEKNRLQEMVLQEKVTAQKEVAKAIITTQEKERSEIGKELHDNVNQLITTAKLYVENIKYYPEQQDAFIEKSVSLLQRSVNEIRFLTKALVPPTFYDIGFEASLHELVDHYRELSKFAVSLTLKACENKLEKQLKLTVYRLIQKQLTNTVKHASAKHVNIEIIHGEDNLQVVYSDDGIGFDPGSRKSGLGLNNIKNRVEVFKGTADLHTAPGKGYRMVVNMPLVAFAAENTIDKPQP